MKSSHRLPPSSALRIHPISIITTRATRLWSTACNQPLSIRCRFVTHSRPSLMPTLDSGRQVTGHTMESRGDFLTFLYCVESFVRQQVRVLKPSFDCLYKPSSIAHPWVMQVPAKKAGKQWPMSFPLARHKTLAPLSGDPQRCGALVARHSCTRLFWLTQDTLDQLCSSI